MGVAIMMRGWQATYLGRLTGQRARAAVEAVPFDGMPAHAVQLDQLANEGLYLRDRAE